MLRFDPPANSTHSEIYPGKGWVSVGWQRFDKWRGDRGYRELGRLFGTSAGNVCTWKQGRVPAKPYLEKLESIADIPPIAWQWWICMDPSKSAASSDEPPPSSGSRSVEGVKLGSTLDELRASVERLTAILAKGKLSPAQVAQLEGKRISALIAISKQEQAGKLEDHPEFDAFVDLALTAFEMTIREHYGLDPKGARAAFASYLEQVENERTAKKNAA